MSDLNLIKQKIIKTEESLAKAEVNGDATMAMVYGRLLAEQLREKNLLTEMQINAGKQGPAVGDISKNLKAGRIAEAVDVAGFLFPFETGAAVIGTFGASFTLYQKVFVPWRHLRLPYNVGQLRWRNALGAAISNPVIKRTYLVVAAASWLGDKWRKVGAK